MFDWGIVERSFSIVLRMLKLTMPSMFVIQFMRESGWLKFLDKYSFAVVRFTGFEKEIGEAFFASIGSAYAGSGILIDLYKRGILSLPGIVLSSVYISLASHVRLVVTYTMPAAFSLLPFKAALGYVGFMFANGILKSISAGMFSHFIPVYAPQHKQSEAVEAAGKLKGKTASGFSRDSSMPPWKSALLSTWRLCRRAMFFAFLSSFVIYWLDSKGVFEALPINPAWFGMPPETLHILAGWFAHLYAGMGMLGQLATEGHMTDLNVFRTCLFCAIASRPIFFIKEAPGYYFGLFGPKIGLCLFAYHMGSLLINGTIVLLISHYWIV